MWRPNITTILTGRTSPWDNCMDIIKTWSYDDTQSWQDTKIWWDEWATWTILTGRDDKTTAWT